MMKLQTSLINIRYAVGVMLAMSAVIAVLIGTSNFEDRDAHAQSTVTVTLSVDDNGEVVKEGNTSDNTAMVTVTLSPAAPSGSPVDVPVALGGTASRKSGTLVGKNHDYTAGTSSTTNNFAGTVRVAAGQTAGTLYIVAQDDDNVTDNTSSALAEGTETVTVSLGNLSSLNTTANTYVAGTDSSASIKILDEENTPPTGTVTIDKTSPKIGDMLTATATNLADIDGKPANANLVYAWGKVSNGTFTPVNDTDATYTVAGGDVGAMLAVRVGFVDDANNAAAVNYVQSAATAAVLNTVTLSLSDTSPILEATGGATSVQVTLGNAAPTGGVDIPLTFGGTAKRKVGVEVGADHDYTVGVNNAFGGSVSVAEDRTTLASALAITAQDDDTGGTGVAEGIETITITLGSLPSGYTAGATSTLTVSIQDEENTPPTGTVTIDTTSPKIGDTLTATTSFTGDKDGHTTFDANTSNDRVGYKWGTVSNGTFAAIGSNDSEETFVVTAAQAGKAIAVRAGFTDDTGFAFTTDNNYINYIQSANTDAVKVSVTVTVSPTTDRKEHTDQTATVTVALNADAPTGGVTIPLAISGTAKRSVGNEVGPDHDYYLDNDADTIDNDANTSAPAVTVAAGSQSGTITITAQDDDNNQQGSVGTAEGIETVIVGLGTLPSGYTAGTTSSVTVSIQDEENTAPTGTVTISDTSPTVADVLTANTSFTGDIDGHTTLAGPDELLNTSDDQEGGVKYEWGIIEMVAGVATFCTGTDANTGCTEAPGTSTTDEATYTVAAGDAGKKLAVRAGFRDDTLFTFADHANYIESASADAVLGSVNLTVTTEADNDQAVTEGNASDDTATVTVTLNPEAGDGKTVTVPVVFTGTATRRVGTTESNSDDYILAAANAFAGELTFTGTGDGGTTQTILVTIVDDAGGDSDNEGTETIVASLGSNLPTGYAAGTNSTQTIKVYDEENSDLTGTPVIKVLTREANVGGQPWKGTASSVVDGVVPGDELVVDLGALSDPDDLDTAAGEDDMLGVVKDDGSVTIVDASTAPAVDDDSNSVAYQWGTLSSDGTFVPIVSNATGTSYTVVATDAGDTIAVRVGVTDDSGKAHTLPAQRVRSAGVAARYTIGFEKAKYSVDEGESVTVTINLSHPLTTAEEISITATGDAALIAGFPKTVRLMIASGQVGQPGYFDGKSATFEYAAPTDGPGQRSLTISFDADSLPTGYVATGSATAMIVIDDSTNSPATADITISDTSPEVGDVLTASYSNLADPDGVPANVAKTYVWYAGDQQVGTGMTYTVTASDVGKAISFGVKFTDSSGNENEVRSTATSVVQRVSTGRTGMISEIKPGIRDVTVSGGDTVMLSVDVYGLQAKQDQKLAGEGVITWSATNGTITAVKGTSARVNYKASSTPGSDTVTASVGTADCRPSDEKMRAEKCSASIPVKVRRPSPPQPEDEAPVNPATIPSILADGSGNQYEVFTPVEGGAFDQGEGYWLTAESGDVPNGELIGVRMSDDGAASNMGMTHQRYTLGGNMYGIHVVDAAGASVSSYELDDPAQVCLPLPSELSSNISKVALVALNADDTLTILSSSVKLGSSGTSVCGNISTLPASVAVGTSGAPDAIPTATPEPTPEPPDTGGTAPSDSNGMLVWAILLGLAITGVGTVLAMARRRRSSSQS